MWDGLAQYLTILLKEESGLIEDMGERAYVVSGNYTWKQNAAQVIASVPPIVKPMIRFFWRLLKGIQNRNLLCYIEWWGL